MGYLPYQLVQHFFHQQYDKKCFANTWRFCQDMTTAEWDARFLSAKVSFCLDFRGQVWVENQCCLLEVYWFVAVTTPPNQTYLLKIENQWLEDDILFSIFTGGYQDVYCGCFIAVCLQAQVPKSEFSRQRGGYISWNRSFLVLISGVFFLRV